MEWKSTSNPPKEKGNVLLQVTLIEGSDKPYDRIYVGHYDGKGNFEVELPLVFDHPVNYWEGYYEIEYWMSLPNKKK